MRLECHLVRIPEDRPYELEIDRIDAFNWDPFFTFATVAEVSGAASNPVVVSSPRLLVSSL